MIRLVTSGEKVGHDSSGDVGETEITAGITIRQLGVIKAELMQQCRVKVVHVYLILGRCETKLVSGTVHVPGLEASACHPHGKTIRIVIATADRSVVRPSFGKFHGGRSPEFPTPND